MEPDVYPVYSPVHCVPVMHLILYFAGYFWVQTTLP